MEKIKAKLMEYSRYLFSKIHFRLGRVLLLLAIFPIYTFFKVYELIKTLLSDFVVGMKDVSKKWGKDGFKGCNT